ncbi:MULTISPECIES: hypothetical protein [unclassified Streptomyces]|uniref:hypothetical protein n=1 Tax=unclassified Streptomyces TaxID=2593676 RepID=UPI002E29E2A0|nr:hypothetical protein [Streptomyces sp. NBC_00334]
MADTLTVRELTDLRLDGLKTAVDDWKTMTGRLEKLATGDDGQVGGEGLRSGALTATTRSVKWRTSFRWWGTCSSVVWTWRPMPGSWKNRNVSMGRGR